MEVTGIEFLARNGNPAELACWEPPYEFAEAHVLLLLPEANEPKTKTQGDFSMIDLESKTVQYVSKRYLNGAVMSGSVLLAYSRRMLMDI